MVQENTKTYTYCNNCPTPSACFYVSKCLISGYLPAVQEKDAGLQQYQMLHCVRDCVTLDTCLGLGRCQFTEPTPIPTSRAPAGSINGDLAEELHARYEMGKVKYGMTLDDNKAEIPERLQHMKEELMDALCYVEWALRAMKEGK